MELTLFDGIGYAAAAASLVAFSSKTMIPLRGAMVASNVLFIAYSVIGSLYPPLILHTIVLPINLRRLWQAYSQLRYARAESHSGDYGKWALTLPKRRRRLKTGDYLWKYGDEARQLWYVNSGKLLLVERGEVIDAAGMLQGDTGVFTRQRKRTLTARCATDVDAWEVSFEHVLELWMQNPEFGVHMTRSIVDGMVRQMIGAQDGRYSDLKEVFDAPAQARSAD